MSELRQHGRPVPRSLAAKHRIADRLVYSKVKERLGGRVRICISGGAPLAKEIIEFFHAIDILILEGYGLTECTTAATVNRPTRFRFGTVGPVLPGVEVRLAEDGEVLIKTDTIFGGYFKDEEATREVLPGDGWLRSGDVGELDDDGFLTITDRKKDILVTAGGKNVAPQNLENALKTHPVVSQALVVGDRRPYIAALITLSEEVDRTSARGADAGDRRRGQPRPLALRADQALHDPAARLLRRGRRGDADAEAQAARLPGALRRRDRRPLLLTDVFLVLSAFLASAVEMVEALTIVLAMGVTRGWRPALAGTAVALLALAAIVAALGPALTVIPIETLRLIVGALLLVFGLQWLRKAILRASGWRALRDEDAVFAREAAQAAKRSARAARRPRLVRVHDLVQGRAARGSRGRVHRHHVRKRAGQHPARRRGRGCSGACSSSLPGSSRAGRSVASPRTRSRSASA